MDDQKITEGQRDDSEQPPKSLLAHIRERFYRMPITWRVVGVAVAGVLVIGATARWLPDMKERMKFFADSALSWLILIVVAVQAYIYSQQREVMERQARSADRSVVFGLR